MSEEKKTTELSEEELKQVSGGTQNSNTQAQSPKYNENEWVRYRVDACVSGAVGKIVKCEWGGDFYQQYLYRIVLDFEKSSLSSEYSFLNGLELSIPEEYIEERLFVL